MTDTVGELSRTCCQLVQDGITTEPTPDKMATCPTKNYSIWIRQQYQWLDPTYRYYHYIEKIAIYNWNGLKLHHKI